MHSIHEDYDRHTELKESSDRVFGLVLAAAFALLGAWPAVHRSAPRWWALAASAALAAIALLASSVLRRPKRVWVRLGMLLNRVTAPVAMGVIFYGVFTPVGIVLRWCGRDALRLRRDATLKSYWIERQPPGPAARDMANPF